MRCEGRAHRSRLFHRNSLRRPEGCRSDGWRTVLRNFLARSGRNPGAQGALGGAGRLEVLGEAEQPSLLGSGAPHKGGRRMTARATLTWPLDNIGPSLPNLMATVAGNLFELKQFSGRLKNRPPVSRRR
jgi:hypothetical protein